MDLPGPGPSSALAGDDKQDYRKALEKAWLTLASAVKGLGPQEQLERYQAFLVEYPADNPYAGKVQKAIEGIEARLDKEAAAKRTADEKAAALEAERRHAAEVKEAYEKTRLRSCQPPATDQQGGGFLGG